MLELPRVFFWIELGGLLFSLLTLWPSYAAQMLVWRFTPRKKWIDTKVHILRVGFVGLVIETIRCPDMSAGFGLMSSMTQRMLYQQLGAILLSAVVLVMLATARSLYVQMSRPVPAVFVRLMWGVVVINQLFVIPVLIGNLVAKHRQDTDLEMWWWAANIVEFSIVAALLVIVYWFLFINLRKRVAAFLLTLLQQEDRRKKEAATAAASASTSAAAVLSVQASKRAALEKKEQREKESAAQQEHAPEQAEDVGADALPSVVPLLSPASPSDGLVELSEVGRADGECDGNDNGGDAATAKTKHLVVGARSATLTHATSSSSSSSSLQLPNSPTPGSSTLLLPPEAPLSPGGNTVHIRLVPSKAAARAVKPSLAQVAPAPTPRASTSASSVAAGAEAGTSAAPTSTSSASATAAGTAAVSQSEARLAELYGALRKLNLLTALVTVLLLGTGCVQIPNLQRYMRGETLSSVVRSPTDDSDGFPFLSGASTCMNQGALMAILWYAYSSPRVWMAEARRASGLRFWHTLLHGIDEAALERYAPAVDNKKKNESVTGGRNSSAAASTAAAAPAAPAPAPVPAPAVADTTVAANSPTGAPTVAPPLAKANSTRNAW